jgi:hypothetical protein
MFLGVNDKILVNGNLIFLRLFPITVTARSKDRSLAKTSAQTHKADRSSVAFAYDDSPVVKPLLYRSHNQLPNFF